MVRRTARPGYSPTHQRIGDTVVETPKRNLKRELATSSAGTLGVRAASLALGFLSTLVLAKELGSDGLGTYAWAFALTATLQILGALGFDRLAPRTFASALATKSWTDASSFLAHAPKAVTLFSAVLAAAVALVCALTLPYDRLTSALAALAFLPVLALTSVRQGILQGLGLVARGRVPDDVLRPLIFTAVIGLGWHENWFGRTPGTAMVVQGCAAVVALQAGRILLRRSLPGELKDANADRRTAEHVREGLPLMLVSGTAVTLTQVDLLLVGVLCPPAEAGLYALATRIGQLVGLAEYAVNAAYTPIVARLYAQGDMKTLQRGSARVALAGFGLAAVVALPVAIAAGPIVSFFGPSFADAELPLRLIALSFLISAAAGQNGTILTMTGRTRAVIVGSVVALVSNVALNAAMIPLWQADGAAFAWVLSVFIWNGWLAVEVRRNLGIDASLLGLLPSRRVRMSPPHGG